MGAAESLEAHRRRAVQGSARPLRVTRKVAERQRAQGVEPRLEGADRKCSSRPVVIVVDSHNGASSSLAGAVSVGLVDTTRPELAQAGPFAIVRSAIQATILRTRLDSTLWLQALRVQTLPQPILEDQLPIQARTALDVVARSQLVADSHSGEELGDLNG